MAKDSRINVRVNGEFHDKWLVPMATKLIEDEGYKHLSEAFRELVEAGYVAVVRGDRPEGEALLFADYDESDYRCLKCEMTDPITLRYVKRAEHEVDEEPPVPEQALDRIRCENCRAEGATYKFLIAEQDQRH